MQRRSAPWGKRLQQDATTRFVFSLYFISSFVIASARLARLNVPVRELSSAERRTPQQQTILAYYSAEARNDERRSQQPQTIVARASCRACTTQNRLYVYA